jgi:hypothetical protein
MPVFNKAPYLREAVESILNGSFNDLELIAVDDRSTDTSLDVLRSFNDERLRIIALEHNLGPAGAVQRAIDTATGEYIVRMDADDIAMSERIAWQVAFMDAHPEVGASGGQLRLFGGERADWRFPLDPDACAAQIPFGVPISQGASILRRSVLELHGIRYDPTWPRVGEDWLFWLRMARHTRFANLDRVILHYRRGDHNIAHGRDRIADYTFLVQEVLRTLGIPGTPLDVDMHLMGLRIFTTPPTVARVRALKEWYQRLVRHNERLAFAPQEAFQARVSQQWGSLFHVLPRYGMRVALQHMRSSGQWPKDRLLYTMKYRLNAMLGKLPNG